MAVSRFPLILCLALALGLAAALSQPGPAMAQSQTQTYVVQKGDTLGKIAKRFYGKSSLGSKLWRANKALVAHPNRLTPGDTLYIFPETTLSLNKPIEVPPRPETPPTELYKGPQLLQTTFPEYFSFVADPRGQGGTGVTRIHVKKLVTTKDVNEDGNFLDTETTKTVDQLYEVHQVGEIIASSDRGYPMDNDPYNAAKIGRLMLSTGDMVVLRFTRDLASILDSETYEDYDPYFNVFPIYGTEDFVQAPNAGRTDYGTNLGQLFKFKGKLNIVSRVEGLVPPSALNPGRAKRGANTAQDLGTTSYVAKITYAEDSISISDRIFVFIPTDPGPERRLDSVHVENPDSYVQPGE
jgi:hypothetical protein